MISLFIFVIVSITALLVKAQNKPLPTCEIYSENKCSGNTIVTDPTFEDHRWYTPAPGSADYKTSYQSYNVLAAHVHLTYDSVRSSVIAEVLYTHRDNVTVSYVFGGVEQASGTKKFSLAAGDKGPVSVSVKGTTDGSNIDLDPIDFVWQAPVVHPIEESKGDYRNGQKGAVSNYLFFPLLFFIAKIKLFIYIFSFPPTRLSSSLCGLTLTLPRSVPSLLRWGTWASSCTLHRNK